MKCPLSTFRGVIFKKIVLYLCFMHGYVPFGKTFDGNPNEYKSDNYYGHHINFRVNFRGFFSGFHKVLECHD